MSSCRRRILGPSYGTVGSILLQQESRYARGEGLLESIPDWAPVTERLNTQIASQSENLARGIYLPPLSSWFTGFWDAFAQRAIAGHFAHVDANGMWDGMPVRQLMAALRPLYARAAGLFFSHLRAYGLMRKLEMGGILLSTVVAVPLVTLAAEMSAASSVDTSKPAMDGQVKTGHQGSVRDR